MLLCTEQIIKMDDDSCVLKYIEIVPLDDNAQQFEDIKPFEVKVCIVTHPVNHEFMPWFTGAMLVCSATGPSFCFFFTSD